MKRLFYWFVVGALWGCSLNSCSNTDDSTDSRDSLAANTESRAVWGIVYDSASNDMKIHALKTFNRDTLQASTVVNFLNDNYPGVVIHMDRISNDTLYARIPDSRHLTTGMGSAGADFYLKTATYLFTEMKGINFVSYDFVEADHAVPGVYRRSDWDTLP